VPSRTTSSRIKNKPDLHSQQQQAVCDSLLFFLFFPFASLDLCKLMGGYRGRRHIIVAWNLHWTEIATTKACAGTLYKQLRFKLAGTDFNDTGTGSEEKQNPFPGNFETARWRLLARKFLISAPARV
jgi:hypothetical protein